MDNNQNPFERPPASEEPSSQTSQPVNPLAPRPSSGTPKKSKLGLILGLSFGGVVLLAGVLVLVLFLVLGGVSKQDYTEAYQAVRDLRSPTSNLSSLYFSTSSTETSIKNNFDSLKKNRTELNQDLQQLGDMKAIKNDQKAQELYKTVADEKVKLDKYLDALEEIYEKIYPIAKELSNLSYSSSSDSVLSTLKSFQAKLQDLEPKQTVNKDYIDTLNRVVPEYISALEAYLNGIGSGSYDPSLYEKYSAASEKLTDADSDWQSNLKKLSSDIELSDAYNDLGEYLTDKVNQ
jgi:uncharacterized coiled-coil protein SlyX